MSDTPRTDAAYFKKGATMYDLAGEMKLLERELTIKGGISIRDYFAAAALQGLLSSIEPNQLWSGEDVAVTCYRTADAMIKAREAK